MRPWVNRYFSKHIKQWKLAAALLVGFALLLTLIPQHSTAKVGTRLVQAGPFTPFLHMVPRLDGSAVDISAGGVGELEGIVFANLSIGPGHKKRGYAMTYSDTLETYDVTTGYDFTPGQSEEGTINITTTLGLDSGTVAFNRTYVPASTSQTISSGDNKLLLNLVSPNTITYNTYILVVPSFAPPGPLPPGHQLIGSAYSVRAAGALLVTPEPMILRLYYDSASLGGADPHTLAIFAWDANPTNPHWENLGGTLFSTQKYLSVATSRFTTYALVSTLTWRDEFDDFSGLDFTQFDNATFGGIPGNRTLILANTPGSGSATSQPVTPTSGSTHWGSLTFTGNVISPTTTMTVDVLSITGTKVLANVNSGSDLSGLDLINYPAFRLRVNSASTAVGQTPALAWWQLSWQVIDEEQKIFLPVLLK